MTDSAVNTLPTQDRYIYSELFKLADVRNKLFLYEDEAMAFFSSTGIPVALLEEIWQTIDNDQRKYITEIEFYKGLKLIACIQHGIPPSDDILSIQVPPPQFNNISIKSKSVSIASITPTERDAYIRAFQNCNTVNGILYAEQAIELFRKSGLSVEHLRDIWELADTRKSGTLNKTEFIIAMHYITRLRCNPHLTLPSVLPAQVYAEASGRFHTNDLGSPIVSNNRSRAGSNASVLFSSPAISHVTSTSSHSPSRKGESELTFMTILPEEKERYAVYFNQLDSDGSGYIDSEEAVYFFNHSQLPNSEIGIIWEIADTQQQGKLNLHDFSVAMHLINMRLRGESIDKYINALRVRQQIQGQVFATQPQQSLDDIGQRYELENQLLEINQQLKYELQHLEGLKQQLQQESSLIIALENEVKTARSELEEVKVSTEKAEESLKLEQKRNMQLVNQSSHSLHSSFSSAERPSSPLPELANASSPFSGVSGLSPRSDTTIFDPFAGFKKSENFRLNEDKSAPQDTSLVPQQSKSTAKYGFDLSAFDLLSIKEDNSTPKSSVKDELISIFSTPTLKEEKTVNQASLNSEFDSIFLS